MFEGGVLEPQIKELVRKLQTGDRSFFERGGSYDCHNSVTSSVSI